MEQAVRNNVLSFVKKQYQTLPDHPWARYPEYLVLRHRESKKWYGLLMPLQKEKLSLTGTGTVDVLNLKCDPLLIGGLCMKPGYFPAYHMNKEKWITVLLDGTVPADEVFDLIALSFTLTGKSGK